ncbi:MAG: hypothetical protein DHS20C18_09420 [Saprospiraceae bacterium]|nr:MAG: hypothetical protein DHS20C18_09420 [Saprospiraceae bacterium]
MRVFYFLCFLFPVIGWAQSDTSSIELQEPPQQIIEDFLSNSESEEEFDFNTLYESLASYRDNPINLNKTSEEELRELNLLTDVQILNFLRYREVAGDLIAIYELQAVPGFDLLTIRTIQPFVSVSGSLDDFRVPIGKMLSDGKNELYLRWSRILEKQKGYTPLEEGQDAQRYLGDPNQLYLRYKHSYENKLSYGFTAEKDRGEAFFTGSNKKGFDYYSAHFYLRNYNKILKALAIGDYSISMGQGLVLYSGFASGKSSQTTNIRRGGRTVRPYTSVNEASYLRGAAITLGLSDQLEFTAFGSYRGRDANLLFNDTLDQEAAAFTSFNDSGLHRTSNEIDDQNAVKIFSAGGSLKYKTNKWHLAVNAMYDKANKSLQPTLRPYNQFYFQTDRILNVSLDYAFRIRNFSFFGETARSDNGAIATVNGVLAGLDRRVDLSILHRSYPRNYQSIYADPFGETSGGRNETGLYIGTEIRPTKGWIISAYYDVWQHPWLRFLVDAPSKGNEYRIRITHFKKRTYQAYIEVRNEVKEKNATLFDAKTRAVLPNQTFQTRLHFAYSLSKTVELRSRIDFGFTDNEVNDLQKGFVVYQDILYKPNDFPLSFTARLALFDTDGFQSRFYSYENNLLYTFYIPPYYNKGSRFYLNLRYRGIRKLTIEYRIAQTFWSNQDTFGSSLEEIQGQRRTEMAAQVKYQF